MHHTTMGRIALARVLRWTCCRRVALWHLFCRNTAPVRSTAGPARTLGPICGRRTTAAGAARLGPCTGCPHRATAAGSPRVARLRGRLPRAPCILTRHRPLYHLAAPAPGLRRAPAPDLKGVAHICTTPSAALALRLLPSESCAMLIPYLVEMLRTRRTHRKTYLVDGSRV